MSLLRMIVRSDKLMLSITFIKFFDLIRIHQLVDVPDVASYFLLLTAEAHLQSNPNLQGISLTGCNCSKLCVCQFCHQSAPVFTALELQLLPSPAVLLRMWGNTRQSLQTEKHLPFLQVVVHFHLCFTVILKIIQFVLDLSIQI